MILQLYLRWRLYCLRTQEEGLRAELAGVEYMLRKNADDQRRLVAEIAMARTERRWRAAR